MTAPVALLRHIPGLQPRKPQRQPPPHQQGPAVPVQRPRVAPKHPLQNALAGLTAPLSLLPQGSSAAAQSDQTLTDKQAAAAGGQQAPARCEVVDPSDPVGATRREISKTVDLLLWGAAVALLCTCCPLGLLWSLLLSLGGAALALLVQAAATCQPELLLQLLSTAGGVDVWSMLAGLDVSSVLVGAALGVAKAGKTLWLLGLDVWSLLAGLVLGFFKLGLGLVLGLAKIAKALLLAGLDVWSLLVGGVVGVAKGMRAAASAWAGRGAQQDGCDSASEGAPGTGSAASSGTDSAIAGGSGSGSMPSPMGA